MVCAAAALWLGDPFPWQVRWGWWSWRVCVPYCSWGLPCSGLQLSCRHVLPALLLQVGFAASFASKLADTTSSEIGKAYGQTTYLVTTLQRVPRGTEGAVSLEGTAAGVVAAAAVAGLALALGQVRAACAVCAGVAAVEFFSAQRPFPVCSASTPATLFCGPAGGWPRRGGRHGGGLPGQPVRELAGGHGAGQGGLAGQRPGERAADFGGRGAGHGAGHAGVSPFVMR